ncbi:MAG: PHP domain-containing protein, partial [Erysipelotrichaceae bacterium]|nr:PHP domain-containing protein [Erysipelotrichaceae bacterium]
MAALLYNRTGYSLMTSTLRIPQLVSFAVENGYEAIGITDNNVIHGFMELYHCTRNTSVKPLYGLEIRITIDEGNYPFVLYAVNNKGLQKLIEISTLTNTENKEYKLDELKGLKDIAVIEIEDGSYSEHLWTKGNADELVKHINTCNTISNLYYGILGNKATEDNYFGSFYAELDKLCSKNKIIAMPLSLYETPQDRETFSILTAIREQKSIDDEKLSVADNCHLMTIDEYE